MGARCGGIGVEERVDFLVDELNRARLVRRPYLGGVLASNSNFCTIGSDVKDDGAHLI